MDLLRKIWDWHENLTYKWIERLQITEYQAMWFAFVKGLVVMLILTWIDKTQFMFLNLIKKI